MTNIFKTVEAEAFRAGVVQAESAEYARESTWTNERRTYRETKCQ